MQTPEEDEVVICNHQADCPIYLMFDFSDIPYWHKVLWNYSVFVFWFEFSV